MALWFRLVEDYKTRKGEIYYDSWGIEKIRLGAPIIVSLHVGNEEEIRTEFMFISASLKHLSLSGLMLSPHCLKDPIWGDVFCAKLQEFFYPGCSGKWIAKKMHFCPLCGEELGNQEPYPSETNTYRKLFPSRSK